MGWLAGWRDKSQVVSELGSNKKRCLELFQPFPASNLVIDGSMAAVLDSLQFVNTITDKAEGVVRELFANRAYISVHLRYEYQQRGESKCRKKKMPIKGEGDTCFVVCLREKHVTLKDYLNLGDCFECEKYLLYVYLDDLGRAPSSFQASVKGIEIYLPSDADSKVIEKLRRRVHFKMISDSALGLRLLQSESMEVVSAIEQALCVRGKYFIGTSYSTWTTTVWLLREHGPEGKGGIDRFVEHLASLPDISKPLEND